MATVAQILYKMASLLRAVYYGTTTGAGTTTTLVDSGRTESVDYFNGGTLFFLTGALAGQTAVVTDYGAGTLTFPAKASAPGAGIDYAVIDRKYRRGALVAAINNALSELGPFVQIDQSLVTVEDQESYSLPAGVGDVLRVEIASDAAAPYGWEDPYRYWREQDGALHFDDNHLPATGSMPIRLHYLEPHARVSADADVINSDADPDLVATLAALHAARNKAMLAGSSDPEPGQLVQLLTGLFIGIRAQRPVRTMQKDSRLPAWIPPQERW